MKALILEVRGAGIFPYHRPNGMMKKQVSHYKIPPGRLATNQVANLLRVLCGQRPVPSLRKVEYTGDKYFDDLAEKSRALVHSFYFDDNERKAPYPRETKASQKSSLQAWSPVKESIRLNGVNYPVRGFFTWERIRREVGDEIFEKIKETLTNLGFEFSDVSRMRDAISFLNTKKKTKEVKNLCDLLKSNRKTSISNAILNDEIITKKNNKAHTADSISIHCACKKLNGLMVGRWPESISKINATIIVPMDDELEKRISMGTGTATFMEGGLVKIVGIHHWTNIIEKETLPLMKGEECYVHIEKKPNKRK